MARRQEPTPYKEPYRVSKRIENKVLLLMARGSERAKYDLQKRLSNYHAANRRSAFRLYEGKRS